MWLCWMVIDINTENQSMLSYEFTTRQALEAVYTHNDVALYSKMVVLSSLAFSVVIRPLMREADEKAT